METWMWIVLVAVIAGVFVALSGEMIITLVLTVFWMAAIYLLIEHGGTLMERVWPAMLVIIGLVVLSIVTLAVLATKMEDRRLGPPSR